MTTPTKEMTPEELNKLQRFNNRSGLMNPEPWGLYVRYEEIALIAQARASLPNAAPAPAVPAQQHTRPEDEQEWAKVDPATAFHLIERHAEDWADTGRMMLAWRDANPPAATSVPAQQIGGSIDTPEFQALLDDAYGAASDARVCGNRHGTDSALYAAEAKLIAHIDANVATKVQAARDEASQWISVDERLPEVGKLVMVYRPATTYDHPEDIRISFDCIDPNDDDHASWQGHNEYYEHFCCVAKPEGSTGPSEKAPYTHWMPIPRSPAATDAGEQQ